MTPSNLDLARECGATYDHQWVDEYVVAGLRFTPLQLDAFAERIRADERAALASAPAQPVAVPSGSHEPDFYMDGGATPCFYVGTVQAMLAQGLAPGWKAVPVKPTDAMVSAMLDWGTKQSEWEAILAAAPQPPVSQLSPAAVERWPLTVEQIDCVTIEQWGEMRGHPLLAHRAYARAIEAAHGITAQ